MNKPKLFRKLTADYLLLATTIISPILIIAGIIVVLTQDEKLLGYIVLVLGIIYIIFAFYRSRRIDKYFTDGYQVSARILNIDNVRRGAYITFEYQINNVDYKTEMYVTNSFYVNELSVDQTIGILVLKSNPKKVLIKDLY